MLPDGTVISDGGLQQHESTTESPLGHKFVRAISASEHIPTQQEVMDLVFPYVLDTNATLFRPYLYRKAGVYARQVLEGETTQSIFAIAHPGHEPPQFVFDAPWEGDHCQVARYRFEDDDELQHPDAPGDLITSFAEEPHGPSASHRKRRELPSFWVNENKSAKSVTSRAHRRAEKIISTW